MPSSQDRLSALEKAMEQLTWQVNRLERIVDPALQRTSRSYAEATPLTARLKHLETALDKLLRRR